MRDDKIIEDHIEEEPQLCDNDTSKMYKGIFGIYIDDALLTFFDGIAGWVVHVNEQQSDNILIRSKLSHLDKLNIPFITMLER